MTASRFVRLAAFSSFAVLSLVAHTSQAQLYSLTQLDTSASRSAGFAINNTGAVAGVSSPPLSAERPVVWRDGAAINLGLPGGTRAEPFAINDAGMVVGAAYESVGFVQLGHATLWNGTAATLLPTLNGTDGVAADINNAGQIVGVSIDRSNLMTHAIVWDGDALIDLGSGSASAINDRGQVVGESALGGTLWNGTIATALPMLSAVGINDAGTVIGYDWGIYGSQGTRFQAQLWSDGTVVPLIGVTANHFETLAYEINDRGQSVGWSADSSIWKVATLWNGATPVDLNTVLTGPDALYVRLTSATAINDLGHIVAIGIDSRTGQTQAYLLAPVPLPAAFWLLLTALGPLGLLARSRSRI